MKPYEKLFLASLGLVSASAKEAKRLLEALSKEKISEKEVRKTFDALIAEGKKSKRESTLKLHSLIKKALKELDIPTRDEFVTLEKKVEALKNEK